MTYKPRFIGPTEMKEIVERFRGQFWPRGTLPVNVELIIESGLGLELLAVRDLWTRGGVEAYITSDFKRIVVDGEFLVDGPKAPRMRFALAHEIGHFVLHQALFGQHRIQNESDYANFLRNMPEKVYNGIEWQANEFAGNLLVQDEQLWLVIQELKAENAQANILVQVANRFGVSEQVIKRRIKSIKPAA